MNQWILLLLLLAAPGVALAQATAADEDDSCPNGAFTSDQSHFGLAKVIGPKRLYLLDDLDGWSQKDPPRVYVIPGDTLVTGRNIENYVCVYFARSGSSGWVPASRLQTVPVSANPPLPAWAGHWQAWDNTLDLTVNADGSVTAKGQAYWPSKDPQASPYGPHIGEVTARSVPKGNVLKLAEEDSDCKVTAHLVGDTLVVSDNLQCGGANVTFNGVYERPHRKPH